MPEDSAFLLWKHTGSGTTPAAPAAGWEAFRTLEGDTFAAAARAQGVAKAGLQLGESL